MCNFLLYLACQLRALGDFVVHVVSCIWPPKHSQKHARTGTPIVARRPVVPRPVLMAVADYMHSGSPLKKIYACDSCLSKCLRKKAVS